MNKRNPSLQKSIFSLIEILLVIFVLFVITGLVLDRNKVGLVAEDFGSSSPLAQSINYSAYSISILLALTQYKRVLKFAFRDIFLWFFIATTILSSIWSENYVLTLGRSAVLLAVTMFGTYLATRYSLSELFRLLCITLGLIAVSSLVFTIISPAEAVVNDYGRGAMRWQGILAHPTQFGRTMALSTVMWLLYSVHQQRYRLFTISVVILSGVLTLFSYAVGSYITVFVASGLSAVLVTSRGRYRKLALIAWLVTILLVIVGLVTSYSTLLSSFNRDTTLTGRIPLWIGVFEMIAQKPLLGYGYGAFWTGNGPSATVWLIAGWKARHAHNGLLDILLQVGLLGFVPFAISIFRNITKALAELKYKGNRLESVLPIILITCLLVANLIETALATGSIFWALYVFLSTYLSVHTFSRTKTQQKKLQMERV